MRFDLWFGWVDIHRRNPEVVAHPWSDGRVSGNALPARYIHTCVELFEAADYTHTGGVALRPEHLVRVYRGCRHECRFGMSRTVDRERAQWFAECNLGYGAGKTAAPTARLIVCPHGGSGGSNGFAWANAHLGGCLPPRIRGPLAAGGAVRGDAGRRWAPSVHPRVRHRHRSTRPGGSRAAGQRASAPHLASDCRSRIDDRGHPLAGLDVGQGGAGGCLARQSRHPQVRRAGRRPGDGRGGVAGLSPAGAPAARRNSIGAAGSADGETVAHPTPPPSCTSSQAPRTSLLAFIHGSSRSGS